MFRNITQLRTIVRYGLRLEVRSVSRIYARSSIVYVTYTIDKCAYMRETERTSGIRYQY